MAFRRETTGKRVRTGSYVQRRDLSNAYILLKNDKKWETVLDWFNVIWYTNVFRRKKKTFWEIWSHKITGVKTDERSTYGQTGVDKQIIFVFDFEFLQKTGELVMQV